MKGPSSSPKVSKVSIKGSKIAESKRVDPPTPQTSSIRESKPKNSEIVDRIYLRAESPIKHDSSLRLSDSSKPADKPGVERRIQIDTAPEIEFKGNLAGLRVVVSSPPPKSLLVESTIEVASPPKPKREAVSVPPKPTVQREVAVKNPSELIGIKVFEQSTKPEPKPEKVAFDFKSKSGTRSTTQLQEKSPGPSRSELKGILKSNSKSLIHDSPESKNKFVDETARKIPPPHATTVIDKIVNTPSQAMADDNLRTAKAQKRPLIVKTSSQKSVLKNTQPAVPLESTPPKQPKEARKDSREVSAVSRKQDPAARSPPRTTVPSKLSQTLPSASQPSKPIKLSATVTNKTKVTTKLQSNTSRPTPNQTMTSTLNSSKPVSRIDRQWKEKSLQQQAIAKEKLKRDRILKEIDREELLHAKLLEKLDAQINRTGSEMERLHTLKSQTKKYLDEIARLKSNQPQPDDLSEVFEKTSQRSVARSPSARLLRSPHWTKKSQKADLDQSLAGSVDLQSVHSRSYSEINRRNNNSRSASVNRSKSTVKPTKKPAAGEKLLQEPKGVQTRGSGDRANSSTKKDSSQRQPTITQTLDRKASSSVPPAKKQIASIKIERVPKPSRSKSPVVKSNIFDRGSTGSKSSASVVNSKSFYQPRESQNKQEVLVEGNFQTLGRSFQNERDESINFGKSKKQEQVTSSKRSSQKQQFSATQRATPKQRLDHGDEEEYRLARTSTDKKPASTAMRLAQEHAVRQLKPTSSLRESTAILQQIYADKRQKPAGRR